MQHFTANGVWHTAEEPEKLLRGTVRLTDDGISLELFDETKEVWMPDRKPYTRIYGVVGKTPYGDFITLFDSFTKRRTMSFAGLGMEVIRSNRGVVGNCYLSPEGEQFTSLEVAISYLGDWFGRSGIEVNPTPGKDPKVQILYRSVEPVAFPIEEKTVTVGVRAGYQWSFRSASVNEGAFLAVENLPKLGLLEAHRKYVFTLQNLLSFATDTPNEAEEVKFIGEGEADDPNSLEPEFHPIYRPIFLLKDKKSDLQPHDMLFTFDEATQSLPNVFQAWFDFSAMHETFCSVYFNFLYAPPTFLEEKFLRLTLAFGLLAKSLGSTSRESAKLAEEIEALAAAGFNQGQLLLLRPFLPTGPEIGLPFFLLSELEKHQTIMTRVVGNDLPAFVRSVGAFLKKARRTEKEPVNSAGERNPLYDAIQKLHILLKVVVLGELGFDEAAIGKFIGRNNFITQMRYFV